MLDSLIEEEGDYQEAEGLKLPRQSSLCLGFEQQEEYLLNLFNGDKLPHALIFSGPKGIGKSTFAFRLTRFLLKNKKNEDEGNGLFGEELPNKPVKSLDVSSDDPVFSKVGSGGHPDLLTIERAVDAKKGTPKNNLDVDTLRQVTPFLRMTASEGGWRVVLIDDADTMNRNAQNALLKILEEPPKKTLIILICHRIGAMIPTIRSRCQTLHCPGLSSENLQNLLKKAIHDPLTLDDEALLLSMSGSQIGSALQLYEEGGLEIMSEIFSIFTEWPKFKWVSVHKLADQLSRPGQERVYKVFVSGMFWLTQTITFAAARNQTLGKPLNQGVFASMATHYSLEQWLGICDKLKQHFDQVDFANLDKKQSVLAAFRYFE
ncbi:MAG: DNA polymerase III subunit delta' [Pseudomonadota bacterium]